MDHIQISVNSHKHSSLKAAYPTLYALWFYSYLKTHFISSASKYLDLFILHYSGYCFCTTLHLIYVPVMVLIALTVLLLSLLFYFFSPTCSSLNCTWHNVPYPLSETLTQ